MPTARPASPAGESAMLLVLTVARREGRPISERLAALRRRWTELDALPEPRRVQLIRADQAL